MARLAAAVSADDHQVGPEDAPLVLVEYGDFDSPECAAAHEILKNLLDRRSDVLFAYRHFPLSDIHPLALPAAYAAEAAARQFAFWDMHDLIFENQEDLSENLLFEFAQELGLDMEKFEEDLAHHGTAKRVQRQIVVGTHSGVESVPAFFINGMPYEGPLDERVFEEALRRMVTTAEDRLPRIKT